MKGFPLGVWDFPSGNRVEVSLDPANGSGVRQLRCAWTRFPPSRTDERHYREVVAPDLYAKLTEYLEIAPRRALVILPGRGIGTDTAGRDSR